MENQEIKYLLAIARHRNISRAAESLFISQPGLSRYLKEREEGIGGRLFQRQKQELIPTELGNIYIRYAEQIEALEKQCNQAMREQLQKRRRRLTLGLPTTRVDDLLMYLVQLREHNSDIEFEIKTGQSRVIWQAAVSGELDMAITNQYGRELKGAMIRQEEVVLIISQPVRERLKLKQRATLQSDGIYQINPQWLHDETFYISGEQTMLGHYARIIIRREKIAPGRIVTLDNAQLAREMAYSEGGVAFAVDVKARASFKHLYRLSRPYYNKLCFFKISQDAQQIKMPQAEAKASYREIPEYAGR